MGMLEFVLKQAPTRERGKWLAELREKGISKKPVVTEVKESDDPVLLSQSVWLWEAFSDISSQRQYFENGPQAVSLSEIESWAEIHAVNLYDRPFMSDMMLKMDRIWLKQKYAEIKREREEGRKRQERQALTRGRGR